MPKILIGLSAALMALSLALGFLNTSKVKALRSELTNTTSARDTAVSLRAAVEKKFKEREKDFKTANERVTAAEEKEKQAEDDLSKAQSSHAELEAKAQANETQIADLQKKIADAAAGAGAPTGEGGAAPNDLKAQLDDTKKQLEAAEQEKGVLADKVKSAQDRANALEEEKKRREAGSPPGLHGTVLAVNQAYNFVVVSLGDRQGIVANSEMLVMRQGTLIGRIRISSVEPATSIGDIITSTLARGVQVLPGDIVVYAGNNS